MTSEDQNNIDKPNRLVIMSALERARAGDNAEQLSQFIRSDPVLCYGFLAGLDVGAVPSTYITTCKQAIAMLGIPAVQKWLEDALKHAVTVTELPELVSNALIRARFLEIMGRTALKREDTEDLYLVGLFSGLDKLLSMPLAELILPLPFPEEMLAAMLEHRGRIGRLLKFAQIIESADETGIDFMQTNMRLPAAQVYDAYNEAYDWMTRVASMSTDVQPAAKGGTA